MGLHSNSSVIHIALRSSTISFVIVNDWKLRKFRSEFWTRKTVTKSRLNCPHDRHFARSRCAMVLGAVLSRGGLGLWVMCLATELIAL